MPNFGTVALHLPRNFLMCCLFVLQAFYEKAEVAPEEDKPQRLIVAITSDRGLCGAVHTSIARSIRNELALGAENIKVICVGDKSRAILQRYVPLPCNPRHEVTLRGTQMLSVGKIK